MISLKIFFLSTIFISCTCIGFLYGNKYSARLENLIYLKQCIKILETEIVYGATPLPDAFNSVYKKGHEKVSFIFKEMQKDLLENRREDVYLSFIYIKDMLYEKLYFKKADVETFISLGRILGHSNREDQEKTFILISNQITDLILEAREEKNKNEKLYKSLGLITGIGIIIILI